MLKQIKLKTKLKFAIIPPIVALGLAIYNEVNSSLEAIETSQQTTQLVDLIRHLDNIAHAHAVERGLSAGFMGSKGNPKIGERLQKQRAKADTTVTELQQLLQKEGMQRYADLQSDLFSFLEQKTSIRSGVDALTAGASAFGFYSSLNAKALERVGLLISRIDDAEVRVNLLGLSYLLWIKERAGQERGKLNGVFASKRASSAAFNDIKGYISEQERYESYFAQVATAEQQQALTAAVKSPELSAFYEYRQQFLKQSKSLDSIQGPEALVWFDIATKRIGGLRGVAVEKSKHIAELSQALYQKHYSYAAAIISAAIVLIMTSLWLLALVVKSVTSRVSRLDDSLRSVIKDGNLTTRVSDNRNDEISSIAVNVNQLLEFMEEAITAADDIAHELGKKSMEFGDAVTKNNQVMEKQVDQTSSIAASVSEMSASAAQTATSASQINDEASTAHQRITDGKKQVDKTLDSMSVLASEISQADQQVEQLTSNAQEIETILGTIRDIAEQTNLLALNAAIEAARAGEQGRGFAVVADEVRALSQRTQESTTEIQRMIDKVREASQLAKESMQTSSTRSKECSEIAQLSGSIIQEAFEDISRVRERIAHIAQASDEQARASADIDERTSQIAILARESANGAEIIKLGGVALNGIAGYLSNLVSRYKISDRIDRI